MAPLLRKYKEAERVLYRWIAARLKRSAYRLFAVVVRLIRAGRQDITILLVPSTERPPIQFRMTFFGVALSFVGFLSIVALIVFFSVSLPGREREAEGSTQGISEARTELGAVKEETNRLASSFESFSQALSTATASLGRTRAKSILDELHALLDPQAESALKSGEAQKIATVRAAMESAMVPLDEEGRAISNTSSVLQQVPSLWPIQGGEGHISQTFGTNPNPFTGQSYFHTGVDFSTYRVGDPVVATAAGKVVFVGVDAGYGNAVVIKHPNGFYTRYGHLSAFRVYRGQKVKQGQVVGLIGNTGVSTGPHVHYEVIIGAGLRDPLTFMPGGFRASSALSETGGHD